MTREEIKKHILESIRPRLEQLGLKDRDIKPGLDLIQSGFVNSMEFVELVAGIETKAGIEIDYETALDDDNFTTLKGILDLFEKEQHGRSSD
jgi:acyl carrier protein